MVETRDRSSMRKHRGATGLTTVVGEVDSPGCTRLLNFSNLRVIAGESNLSLVGSSAYLIEVDRRNVFFYFFWKNNRDKSIP